MSSDASPLPAPTGDRQIAAIAKALAHPARVRIVRVLLSKPGCIGGDIVEEIGLAQSTVSEHLRLMKEAGLVVGEIEHPRVCYSLAPEAVAELAALLGEIARHEAGTHCVDAPAPPLRTPSPPR